MKKISGRVRGPFGVLLKIAIGLVGGFFALYVFASWRYSIGCSNTVRATCKDHLLAGCAFDGVYSVDFGKGKTYRAFCDMTTEFGGWMMVLNYIHKAKAPKATLAVMSDRFPFRTGASLGDDESRSENSWGHLSPELLNEVPFTEMRFFCRTSSHDRNLNFKITAEGCLKYFKTGKGSCADALTKVIPLAGHNGLLFNDRTLQAGKDNGSGALTNHTFYVAWRYHWNVGTEPGRWECDDMAVDKSFDTDHEVYVR